MTKKRDEDIASIKATASDMVEDHQILKLDMEDCTAFVDDVLDPPAPNAALKSAALRYQQEIAI
jgi:uncharacterized protein (DUF1778 family)